MTHYIVPWSPLTTTGSITLIVILFVAIGLLLFIGTRIHQPLAAKRPGLFLGICIVVIFLLSGFTYLMAEFTYGLTLEKQLGGGTITEPANHVTPITLACGVVAFFVIVYLTSSRGNTPISPRRFWVAVGSAVVGTIAAPLIFELPFDLIVMGRVYSPTPHALFMPALLFATLAHRDLQFCDAHVLSLHESVQTHPVPARGHVLRLRGVGRVRLHLPVGPDIVRVQRDLEDPGVCCCRLALRF